MTPEQALARERALVDWVLDREGGGAYTEHPNDIGRATRWGITQAAWGEFLGLEGPAPACLVAVISEAEARAFYRERYVLHPKLRLDLLEPLATALIVIDGAVLFGRGRAAQWAQAAAGAGLKIDGQLGEMSRAAILAIPPPLFLGRVQAMRMNRHVDRCIADPSQLVFLRGWSNRTCGLAEALT